MKHTFRKHERKSRILMALGGTVVVLAVCTIGLVVYTLYLRTRYKETVRQIADHANGIHQTDMSITYHGETLRASDSEVNYYLFVFMLSPYTVPYNRAKHPQSEDSIVLTLGDSALVFTPLPDADKSNIHVSWKTPEEEICYTLRSDMTFRQLESYIINLQIETG